MARAKEDDSLDILVYNMSVTRALPIFLLLLALVACSDSDSTALPATSVIEPTLGPTASPTARAVAEIKRYSHPGDAELQTDKEYQATIETSLGTIVIDLFAKDTPTTVNNFVFLARDDFYDGVIFHRVIPLFMIQSGDPRGTGTGGPGYSFEDEIVSSLAFDRPGLLAMANSGPGTNGSQFFITLTAERTSHLTGAHTIFGEVVEGQDVVDAISTVSTAARDKPLTPVVIENIEITETPG